MNKSKNTPVIQLMEKFDRQLHDLLITDLLTIRSAKVKMLNRYRTDQGQDQLMTA